MYHWLNYLFLVKNNIGTERLFSILQTQLGRKTQWACCSSHRVYFIIWSPTTQIRWTVSLTLTIRYWRLVWLHFQNCPDQCHTHEPHTGRVWASLEKTNNTQNKREKQVSPWKSQAMSDSVCGNNLINYMFTWRKLRLLCSSELMGHWVNVPPPKEAISEPVISCSSWTAVRLFPKYICCFKGAFLQSVLSWEYDHRILM